MADNSATRQRRRRRRQRERRWIVRLEMWPDLIDALETAGFAPLAGIETREDAEAAVEAALLRWEMNVDRLRPHGPGDVTRDAGRGADVVDKPPNRKDDRP